MKLTLKERLQAVETKFGKLLMYISAICLTVASVITEYSQFSDLIPEDFVPVWLKITFGLISLFTFFMGKLSVAKDEKGNPIFPPKNQKAK